MRSSAYNGWRNIFNRLKSSCDSIMGNSARTLTGGIFNFDKVMFGSSKGGKIRNRYNQVPHLTLDTNGEVTNLQWTPQTRAKGSSLSKQMTTKHI